MRTRRTALLVLFAVFGTLLVPASIDKASADGTPDLLLAKSMPQVALLGSEIPVSVTVSNPGGPNGYNVTFTETLPAGVSYVGGSSTPEPSVLPQGDGSTVLVWENVADAIVGATVTIDFSIIATVGFDPGDSVIATAGVYAHNNPRTVPDIDPVTGIATGDFSGSDTAARSTRLIPFALTKSEPSNEGELLRGVHDHQTVYTLTIDNNLVNSTSGLSIIDYLPAGLEFLGCGGVDNTSGGDEYPGSGAVNPGNEPTFVNPCITPTSIATVSLDPDGLGVAEAGIYTRLTWNAATLATTLPAGGTFLMDYLAAVPLRQNVQTSVGDPTANLGNNTGALTTETEDALESYAVASGIYGGNSGASTDNDYHEITAEDLSIHKTVDDESFVQGDTPTFTLLVETSEYATTTGPLTVTDTLPPALDFVGATPGADSAVVQGDGSTKITWTLPGYAAPNGSTTLTVNTLVRTTHRNGDGSDGAPVSSNDGHTNLAAIAGDATVMVDGAGTTTTMSFIDDSSASQTALGPTILKQISTPVIGTLTCGDGTGVTFIDTTASSYRPGDRVCFRLDVDFPSSLDTLSPIVADLLPDGFVLESWTTGASSDVDSSSLTFTDESPALEWQLGDQDVGGVHVEIVVSTIIEEPDAAVDGDIIDNLMKFRSLNATGGVFQLRDRALAEWSEAQLDLTKGVTLLNGAAVAGAPADGVTVEEGDLVTFELDISNSGSVPALDTTVRDVLPTELTCADISAISTGGVCDGVNGWIDWDTSSDIDVAGGTSVQLTYVATIPVGTSAGATLTNHAGVQTYAGETNTGASFTFVPVDNIDPSLLANTSAADDVSEVVTTLPTLVLDATTSVTEAGNSTTGEATIGETVTYSIDVDLPDAISYYNGVVTNIVDSDKDLIVSSVVATLDASPLPAGFTLTADDAMNTITIDFPASYAVPDGADQKLLVTFDAEMLDVAASRRGAVSSNQADFSFGDALGATRNVDDSVDIDVVEPNVTIGKVNDDPDGKVVAGQIVSYTIDVDNPAAGRVSVAHETVVVDTIPDELVVLEAPGDPAEDGDTIAPDGGLWNATARTITWDLATMDPGESTQLRYSIQIGNPLVAAGTLRNSAEVTASSLVGVSALERSATSVNGDTDGEGYQDSDTSDVVVPVIDIRKSVSSLTATVGSELIYTLVIDLPAGVIAYDVTVLDDLPAGLGFESISTVTCVEGGSNCSPDITAATPIVGGGDVAFFLGDLTTEAVGDRVLTIEYVSVVDDVAQADDGSTLQNTATVYWNDSDTISGTPASPPAPSGFSDASSPWSVVVNTDEPALTIDKDVAGQVDDDDWRRAKPGDTLSYTITVSSSGSSPAYSATVVDIATDDSWLFTDTTTTSGITNTDADPVGGLAWLIDGPLVPGTSTTITYDLVVPTRLTATDEIAGGADGTNTVDITQYFGIGASERGAHPSRPYRLYDDVDPDAVEIELDLANVGGVVWFDANGDGVHDTSEPGLPDVDVDVTYHGADGALGGGDDVTNTISTDSDGSFLADRLPGGNYTVDVDETDPDFLSGVVASYDRDGTTINPNGSWSGVVAEDSMETDVDFGYAGTGSIGDTVWFDQNRDGVIDGAEARLENVDVTVTWLGPDGAGGGGDDVVYLATTDALGNYLVNNLPPGDFTVAIETATLPAGYGNVSDPGGENDNMSILTLGGGAADLDQDFGYAGTDLIGDLIWLDQDDDGTQNGSEPGLGGIMIELTHFGPDGVRGGIDDSLFATTTDSTGHYEFDGLPPGVFEVEITGGVPAGTTNSSDPDTASPGDSRSTLTLTAGNANLDQDFGFSASSVLGDRVWWDLDADGVQDLGEPGLNGIEITATYLGPDTTLGTTDDQVFFETTSGDGDYLFIGVPDGPYTVAVTNGVPSGFNPVSDEDSGTIAPDATTDVNLSTAHLTADFSYSGSGSLGDTLWFDVDLDGIIGPDEFGLADVDLNMTWLGPDSSVGGGDDIILTAATSSDGTYTFSGLPAGTFSVAVVEPTLPSGFVPSFDADSGLTSPDGTSTVVLATGESELGQDFGYAGTGSIGDTVWFDRNGDGAFNGDDIGLGNVDVEIVWASPMGPQAYTATTDVLGTYVVDNLPPGDFTVGVVPSSLPGGMVPTFDADGGFDGTSASTLSLGTADLDSDFGYRGNAEIGDTIWLDINGDGTQEVDEPGLKLQHVELVWQSPTGEVAFTTETDALGTYRFGGLPDGDYTVTVIDGIVDIAANTGDPGADGDSTNDLTISGANDLEQDFGYQGPNSIGDLVWMDDDRDGSFDATERGIADIAVEVVWFGVDGVPGGGDDVVLPRVTTDADGLYLVAGLPDGSYFVEVADGLPDGLDTPTFDADGGTENPDGTSELLELGQGSGSGVANNDQDFGYTGGGTIGETIWLNLNGDAVQNGNEPGMPNVGVILTWAGFDAVFDTIDDVVYPAEITDTAGRYHFDNLAPGLYDVAYDRGDLPPGITPQVDPDGGDLTAAMATLTPDQELLTQNFGVAGNATLTGSVFVDSDGDGVQGADEKPIADVTMTVRWTGPMGPIDFTSVTDVNGRWELINMPPGQYLVLLGLATAPPGLVPTLPIITELVVAPASVAVVHNGLVPAASIGDLVWHDDDRSGAVTAGEIGVEHVRVNLANGDGDVVQSTESALDGSYLFEGLAPGDYTVSLDESSFPDGMEIVASPEDDDDDQSLTTIALAPAADVDSADFGLDDPDSDKLPALAFTGRTVGDLVLLGGVLVWIGMMLTEGTRPRRKPEVVQLKITSDGRRVVT